MHVYLVGVFRALKKQNVCEKVKSEEKWIWDTFKF